VNGAETRDILIMLNMDFLKWIFFSILLAVPVGYLAMVKWLESFVYQTALRWWIFAFAGLLAILVALLTVSIQSWKASRSNPVEALRYE
jgi:putative ABC transport system permease protein